MQLTASDITILNGLKTEQEKRDFLQQKMTSTAKGPPRKMGPAPMRSARGTHTGGRYGTYVAASPFEHLANAIGGYKRNKMIGEENQTAQEAYEARKQASGDLAGAIAGADLSDGVEGGFVHVGNGVFMNPDTGQEVSSEEWMNRKQTVLDKVGNMARVPDSVKRQMAEGEGELEGYSDLQGSLAQHPEAFGLIEDSILDVARNIWPRGGVALQGLLKSPEESSIQERVKLISDSARNKLYGATLTDNEQAAWDAIAPDKGTSAAEVSRRLSNLSGMVQNKQNALNSQFGGGQASAAPANVNADMSSTGTENLSNTDPQAMRINRGGTNYVSYDGGKSWQPE